jgi:hypothetical protein
VVFVLEEKTKNSTLLPKRRKKNFNNGFSWGAENFFKTNTHTKKKKTQDAGAMQSVPDFFNVQTQVLRRLQTNATLH